MTCDPFVEISHIAWFTAKLAGTRYRIDELLRRLKGIGSVGALKPSLLRKFLHMLDDVAAAKKHEIQLIEWIETIECRHRFLRAHSGLKRACSDSKTPAFEPRYQVLDKDKTTFPGFLRLLAAWYLFAPKK